MNQESVIQSKSETENQISHINTYLWNPENGADDPISRVGTEMQMQRRNVDTAGKERGGARAERVHTPPCGRWWLVGSVAQPRESALSCDDLEAQDGRW